jgi:hypothetical protein
MKLLKVIAIGLAVIIVVLLGVILFAKPVQEPAATNNATSTQQATFSPDGSIAISMPAYGGVIASPVGIVGQAAGNWFFEGSFPIMILDGDGTVLGTGAAQALGNWMTTSTVAFSANIPFTMPKYTTGTIVFANDNPSGAPQNAKQFRLQIHF